MENINSVGGAETSSASGVAMATGKQPKMVQKKPCVVALVIMAVLMLAGVGFGVYGMIRGMQKDEIANKWHEITVEESESAAEEDAASELVQDNKTLTAKNLLMRGDKVLNWDDGAGQLVSILVSSNFGDGLSVELSQQMAGVVTDCYSGEEKTLKDDEFRLWAEVNWDVLKRQYALEKTIDKTGREDIEITGIDAERVVDVLVAGFGQAVGNETILVLMDDGTIEYVPVAKALREGFRSYGKVEGVEDVVLMRGHVTLRSGCIGGGGLNAVAQRANGDLYNLHQMLLAQGAWN